MNPRSLRYLVIEVEAWGDAFTPACRCGCGEPVRISVSRGPNKYVNSAHDKWDRYGGRQGTGKVGMFGPVVEREKFKDAVEKIRAAKGWTIRETSLRGGWNAQALGRVYYGPGDQITEERARKFLRRLAGMPEELSAYQRRQMDESRAQVRRAENEIRNSHMRERKKLKKGDVGSGERTDS